jgi:predicted secreted hydrolase
MAGKNYAFTVQSKQKGADAKVITLDNAASLTIYQLRQELTRRGIFDEVFGADGEKRHINFENCLQVSYQIDCTQLYQ